MFSLARKAKLVFFIGIIICLSSLAVYFILPRVTHAQTNTSAGEDQMCIAFCQQALQNSIRDKNPAEQCPPTGAAVKTCKSPSSGGSAFGICQMAGCLAIGADGVGGKGDAMKGLGDLAKQVGDILGKLMQGGGGGGDSGGGTPTTPTTGTCAGSYYPESTTLTPTDPCAYYVPPGGTTIGTTTTNTSAQDLLDALKNTTGNNLLNLLGGSTTPGNTNNNNNTGSSTNLNGDVTTVNITGSFNPNDPNNSNPNQPVATNTTGLSGSIQTTATGATFVSNQIQGNSETSSFFGGDGVGGFISNIISGWCTARPWASGFIASVIPPTFFDGLCKVNGFAVGTAAPAAPGATNTTSINGIRTTQGTGYVNLTQTPVRSGSAGSGNNTTAPARPVVRPTTPVPTTVIPGRVDIWAVPPSVALGARTTIFWNTENVSNCVESSPDGSFRQTSLSGGAATVPLTGPTTFTISCLDTGNNPTTDYVTVNIGN